MQDIDKLGFEQAFQQLEEVIRGLEQGDLPLDEALSLYERGMLLARLCADKLDAAEQQVSRLAGAVDDHATLAPFSPED